MLPGIIPLQKDVGKVYVSHSACKWNCLILKEIRKMDKEPRSRIHAEEGITVVCYK